MQRGNPDLVLLDMVMPGADGLETLQRIREARPSTKVVMLSCVRDTRKVAQAMRLGAQDYLSKPVQKEEMDEVLRFCLENTDPASPGAGEAIEVSQGVYFFSATPQMRQLRAQAMQVARFDFPVLLLGESGTGKEVLAHLIHKYSDRVAPHILEGQLRGRAQRTAGKRTLWLRTGSVYRRQQIQAGQVRAVQQGHPAARRNRRDVAGVAGQAAASLAGRPVLAASAAAPPIKVDVRVLAATNINMPQAIAQKTFREDLYYRLNSFVLRMPSLRERREEIPMMLRHFMIHLADRYACAPLTVSPRLVEACENYDWPGNIRELENFVKRFLVLGDESAAIAELQKGTGARRAQCGG